MPLQAGSSPSVVWSEPAGFLRCDPVTVRLEDPPPIASLHAATRIHWEPALSIALCSIAGQRRPLTPLECQELQRWATTIQTAVLDARDGGTTLAVIFG